MKHRKNILWLFILFTALFAVSCKTAEFGFKVIDIHGMVYDFSNRPVAHCEISLSRWHRTVTDINGRFTLPKVAVGTYTVTASKKSFETYAGEIRIADHGQIIYLRLPSQNQLLDLVDEALTANDFAVAEELAERAYRIDPNNIEMLFYYATVSFRQEDYPKAAGFLEAAKSLGSKDIHIDKFLAILRRMQNAKSFD